MKRDGRNNLRRIYAEFVLNKIIDYSYVQQEGIT